MPFTIIKKFQKYEIKRNKFLIKRKEKNKNKYKQKNLLNFSSLKIINKINKNKQKINLNNLLRKFNKKKLFKKKSIQTIKHIL